MGLERLFDFWTFCELGQSLGDQALGTIEKRRVHRVILDDDQIACAELKQGFIQGVSWNVELLESVVELLARRKHMPFVDSLANEVKDAALHPADVVARDSERFGDSIGSAKTDASNLLGHDVGVVADDARRVGTVLSHDVACGGGAHPKRMEKAHRLGLDPALPHRVGDRLGALAPDPGDFAEPHRLGRDDVEGVLPKALDETGRQRRPDAWDQPRAEVTRHALLGGRDGWREGGHPKPTPVDRVLGPATHQAYVLPWGDLP